MSQTSKSRVSYSKEHREAARAQGKALFTFQLRRPDGSNIEMQGLIGASDARALEIAASMVGGGLKLPELEELLRTARDKQVSAKAEKGESR